MSEHHRSFTFTRVGGHSPKSSERIDKASVSLDQWADGPVAQGDFDGTGKTDETFLHGNLNPSKAHYNEGDAVPYRAILDNLQTGVTYGVVIQWDTVDQGGYAIDYLTGYNFSFEGAKHPGEPDADPLKGVTGLSSNSVTTAEIQADPQLLTGFGSQYGATDGLGSGQPSGQQFVSLFGSVDGAHVTETTYNADHSKASVTVFFTYTGSRDNNADAVVVAWGGHIASSAAWDDDPSDNVTTAMGINGSPYHMRVLSLSENGKMVSVGNQDRSMQSNVVSPPPTPHDTTIVADEDNLATGNNDSAPGDDNTANLTGTLAVTGASNVDLASMNGQAVLDTGSAAVLSGGHALTYFWDPAGYVLYASTDASSLAQAQATAAFKLELSGTAHMDYAFTLLQHLDHPTGEGTAADNTEDPNIYIDLTYTAIDGSSVTGTIHVTVDDDMPARATGAVPIAASVDEDGMAMVGGDAGDLSNGNGTDTSADETSSVIAGSLASLVSMGADQPGVIGISTDTSALPHLYSKGEVVTYAASDTNSDGVNDTLTATAGTGPDARVVFTLHVATDGSWTFDLDDQLDHVAGNGENTDLITAANGSTHVAAIDFSSIVQATDSDGDTVAPLLSGDFSVSVVDDVPVQVAEATPIAADVYENGMSTTLGDAGDLSDGNGTDQSADEASSAGAGSLAALVSVGADEPVTFGVANDFSGLPSLYSKGELLSYAASDTNADGIADTLVGKTGSGATERVIFTLHIGTDGSWEFDLDDQLDHMAGNGENTDLITALDGSTHVGSINFSSIVTALDNDGDPVAPFTGSEFTVTVHDDVPVQVADATPIAADVYENGMSTTLGDAGDLSDGNGTDQSADEASSAGAGSLAALVSVGADEPVTFGVANDFSGLPDLYSKGEAVTYAAADTNSDGVDDTLTATAGTGPDARVVFTLHVATDGSWTFDLDDQLDHVAGNGENTDLITALDGSTHVGSINFSSIVTAVDNDGDPVAPFTGSEFTVTVHDDVPVRVADATPIDASVREDGMSTSLGDAGDLSEGNRAPGGTLADDETGSAIAGSLATLIAVGADEPPTFGLASDTSGLPTLYSKGEALVYAVSDSDADLVNDTLTATAGTGPDARVVFTLHVATDGSWTFDLDDQLDHVAGNGENTDLITAANGSTHVAAIDFSSIVQASDYDQDVVAPLVAGDFTVAVRDDVPVGFTPATMTLVDDGSDSDTALLNAAAAVGADEPGTVVFVDNYAGDNYLRDTGGVILQSGKEDIVLSGFGTDTLVGSTSQGTVFTATLDPATDHYTIDFDRPIDNGSGIEFKGAAPVKSGNLTFNVINDVGGTPIDLLFSGGQIGNENPLTHTVNVSTQGAGTGNQTMDAGETLRIDFVTNATLTGSPTGRDFTAGAHQAVDGFSFLLTQDNPGGTTGTVYVTAWDCNDDKSFTNDTKAPITKVEVNGHVLYDNGTVTDLTVNGHTVHAIAYQDGVIITGLNEGLTGDGAGGDDPEITVFDGTSFNRIEISNFSGQTVNSTVLGGGNFDIAPAGLDSTTYGHTLNFELPVQLTDYDGDTSPVEVIGVQLDPITQ